MNTKSLTILGSLLILAGCAQQPSTTSDTTTTPSTTPSTTTTTETPGTTVTATPSTTDTTMTPSTGTTVTTTPSTTVTPSTPTARSVNISNFAFSPADLSVKQGTTVTWTNQDTVAHTVTADLVSTDAPNFGSNTMNPGDSYSYTFSTAGTFSYHCSIHPSMKASVTVTL